jgi:serine/threonine protein kinase
VRERGEFGVASDMYSLGALTYFLLVGDHPPAAHDLDEVRSGLEHSALVGHQPRVIDHILGAMATDPGERPTDVAAWAQELRDKTTSAMASTYPAPAPRPVPTEVAPTQLDGAVAPVPAAPPPEKKRRRAIWIAAAIALLLVAGAAALLLAGSGDDEPSSAAAVSTTRAPRSTTTSSTTTSSTTTSSTTSTTSPTTSTTRPGGAVVATGGVDLLSSQNRSKYVVSGTAVNYDSVDINGQLFENGVYGYCSVACSPVQTSSIDLNLSRSFKTLTGTLGVTDRSQAGGSVQIQITVDGTPAFDKSFTLGQSEALNLDVTNALRVHISWTGTLYKYFGAAGGLTASS